jgi:hypothetical protein
MNVSMPTNISKLYNIAAALVALGNISMSEAIHDFRCLVCNTMLHVSRWMKIDQLEMLNKNIP